jgi:photosystem II stability/assembly factor-like uncharacterized protein
MSASACEGLRPTFVLCFLVLGPAIAQAQWASQTSNTSVALRGVSAVSDAIAWASGAKGTFLRTADGGVTWVPGVVSGAADADFRGVRALSDKSAYLLSSGAGSLSRLYKTGDGGVKWDLLMVNPNPKGFWDAIAMWDPMHGILLGDPVNGRFVIWTMSDGNTWVEQKGPPALPQEGAFAASNTSLFVRGAREAWFGTGGTGGGRVFRSDDGGKSWTVAKALPRPNSETAGMFSLAFSDTRHGVAIIRSPRKEPARSPPPTTEGKLGPRRQRHRPDIARLLLISMTGRCGSPRELQVPTFLLTAAALGNLSIRPVTTR